MRDRVEYRFDFIDKSCLHSCVVCLTLVSWNFLVTGQFCGWDLFAALKFCSASASRAGQCPQP